MLMMASGQINARHVEYLIDAGLDVNAVPAGGSSPLYEAAHNGYDSVVSVLAEKGGDVYFRPGNSGWTPLMTAVAQNHLSTVSTLIKAGADINAKDQSGYTPLLIAAFYHSAAMARNLCDNGADIDAQESGGWTALHYAAYNRDEDMAAILLLHKTSVDITDKKGHPALWYTQKKRNTKIVVMLKNPDPAFIVSVVPGAAAAANAADGGRMDETSMENVRSAMPLQACYSNIVFHRFEVPEQLKKDSLEAAIRCEQSSIEYLKNKNVYKNIMEKADSPYEKNTVLVDGFVDDIYYAGTVRRFFLGQVAGTPFMKVRVKLTDAESNTVIREKVISTATNAWLASATKGTSDVYLPIDMVAYYRQLPLFDHTPRTAVRLMAGKGTAFRRAPIPTKLFRGGGRPDVHVGH